MTHTLEFWSSDYSQLLRGELIIAKDPPQCFPSLDQLPTALRRREISNTFVTKAYTSPSWHRSYEFQGPLEAPIEHNN